MFYVTLHTQVQGLYYFNILTPPTCPVDKTMTMNLNQLPSQTVFRVYSFVLGQEYSLLLFSFLCSSSTFITSVTSGYDTSEGYTVLNKIYDLYVVN